MTNKIINYEKIDKELFRSGKPFPNIVIDGLFDSNFMLKIEKDYPLIEDVSWWSYDNHFEKKFAYDNIRNLPDSIQEYFKIINSWDFVKKIEEVTGITGLIADPSLWGAGLHRIERGGKLDIHADFNYHRLTGWRRRLNIITFLNKNWDESYGGHTELWDKDMKECVVKVLPIFNRTVMFVVDDDTFHGHPDPLMCPENMTRRSLAAYYYTLHDDNINEINLRSTDYKKRPSDLTNKKIEKMREERRKGRLRDMKT